MMERTLNPLICVVLLNIKIRCSPTHVSDVIAELEANGKSKVLSALGLGN